MPLEPVSDPTWREIIAQHRLRAGLTKQELAELCGVSRQTLYRIESGKYEPTDEMVEAIETALSSSNVAS